MNKKIIIIITGILLIIFLIFGITKLAKKSPQTFEEENVIELSSEPYCGDGYCDVSENCKNCIKDCSCASDGYCSKYNVCLKREVCGDEICTEREKQQRSCCVDCLAICSNNELCNEFTKRCVAKIELSQDSINRAIKKYEDLNYTLLRIDDINYKERAAKEIIMDCTFPEDEIKCRVRIIVSEDGTMLDEDIYSY